MAIVQSDLDILLSQAGSPEAQKVFEYIESDASLYNCAK